ncbi:gamma-aminobutyric acid type B receptor subunit 2-like [Lingula anatina]|uniref:Gamma-aminobutyric acid type B receptor subunit 2-like n=1 Tax=Lingula anatina TaxID=7574 RepID=A0A1S3IIZ0_LINAN|nr:gamma-aminobutyric acid type B receptor subunit 2-like [Lingula anatina]|eukprot:XP_013398210.1 gamma-aminobutyric acid type B receptor subunit 2-like [Lingula anatina]
MNVTTTTLQNLTLVMFAEINVKEGWNSAGVVPALEMAVHDVNADPNVLPGYHLNYVAMDTKCNEGAAAAALVRAIQRPPQKIILIGGGCSVSTLATAQTTPFFNLIQISYGSSRLKLSKRDIYRTFWRNIPTKGSYLKAHLAIVKHYGWKRVATIGNECQEDMAVLHKLFQSNGIENLAYHTVGDIDELSDVQIQDLKNRDARIIIFDGYEQTFRRILCKAYRFDMSGGKVVWIFNGWYSKGWMSVNDTVCDPSEVKAAAEHGLTLMELMTFEKFTHGQETINGLTFDQYERRYKQWPSFEKYGFNEYHPYGYDAIWAAALALNSSIPEVAKQVVTEVFDGETVVRPKRLDDFTYEDSHLLDVLMEELKKTNFTGMTGPMSFYENGSRPWQIEITQVQDSVQVAVGVHNEITGHISIDESLLKWAGGQVPLDHTPVVNRMSYIDGALAAVITGLAGLGILLGLSLLVFNIVFMNHRHIKLSSPNLNNVIATGCVVAFSCVPFVALDTRLVPPDVMPAMCMTSGWLLSIAFSLAFGAMFAKTWRVYKIFRNKSGRMRKPLQDKHLLLGVAFLVMVDVAVMVTWTVIDPMYLTYHIQTDTETDGKRLITKHESCTSELKTYWIGGLLAEKGLLLIFGCFLAFETRKVFVPELNDSK